MMMKLKILVQVKLVKTSK